MGRIVIPVLLVIFLILGSNCVSSQTYPSADQVGVFSLEKTNQAEDLGVGWTRFPLSWAGFEKNKEGFNKRLQNLKNVKVIITIRATHPRKMRIPAWAKAYFEKHPDVRRAPSCPPKSVEEYKKFIREAVRMCKDKVAAWQIENEVYLSRQFWIEDKQWSIQEFIPVFKAAAQVIREEDPGKPILAPGIAFINAEFDSNGKFIRFTKSRVDKSTQKRTLETWTDNIRDVFVKTCPYFDVVDVHLYGDIESYSGKVMWVKAMMKETNCNKQIWATEISGPKLESLSEVSGAFYEAQAKELPLRLQAALDASVEKAFYFLYRDGTTNHKDIIYTTCGLVTKDGEKKPAYRALQKFMGCRREKK